MTHIHNETDKCWPRHSSAVLHLSPVCSVPDQQCHLPTRCYQQRRGLRRCHHRQCTHCRCLLHILNIITTLPQSTESTIKLVLCKSNVVKTETKKVRATKLLTIILDGKKNQIQKWIPRLFPNDTSTSFLRCTLGVRRAIRRHQPPQKAVVSQVDCFIERELVGSQTALDGQYWEAVNTSFLFNTFIYIVLSFTHHTSYHHITSHHITSHSLHTSLSLQ